MQRLSKGQGGFTGIQDPSSCPDRICLKRERESWRARIFNSPRGPCPFQRCQAIPREDPHEEGTSIVRVASWMGGRRSDKSFAERWGPSPSGSPHLGEVEAPLNGLNSGGQGWSFAHHMLSLCTGVTGSSEDRQVEGLSLRELRVGL